MAKTKKQASTDSAPEKGTGFRVINEAMESVALSSLKPHPKNPRQGDVGAIYESIEANGFYGAVVAQKSTGHVLAGNHRMLAAQHAGAGSVPVVWVDVDDETALRIPLADNRTNDVASYDTQGWVWLFDIAESCGYGVRSMIVWDKGTPGMGRGWRAQHELVLWACKATPPFDKHASGVGNVVGEKRTGNQLHTTEKPVSLIAGLITNTPFAKTVYDPFLGSGTTMVAAEQERRACYGMELDPAYVAVILKRLSGMGLTPTLAEKATKEAA